jgi:hypothetical protein
MTRTRRRNATERWALGALVVGLAACAGSYVYQPAENATARISGQVAARYPIPPESPRGEVRVASFGVTKLEDAGRTLHVRMVVENNGDDPWTVDTREQLITIPGEGQSRPLYANTASDDLPIVQVDPRGQRTLDLFYPLPPDMQGPGKIPEFDLLWSVRTPERLVTERTPFDRLQVEPQVASVDWGFGYGPMWGPAWWYDPWYGRATFVHRPVIIGPPIRHPVPRPHWRW